MKRSRDTWRAALLAALFTLIPAGLAGQEVTDTDAAEAERAILEVQETMRAAARARDADALFEYVLDTDTPPIIENGRILPTWAEALRSTAEALRGLRSVSYDYTREDITMLSPTLALWVGAGRATATLPDGREITAPFAETMVLARREGGWKVLHAHRSAPER
jgi:ketosteroid isomerase-like protein